MLTEEQMRDALRQCPHDTVENLRVRWLYAKDFARAIESAATAPLLAEIERLTRELAEARKDAERYRWLRGRKSLELRSDRSKWTRIDGSTFISSHFLAEGGTQHSAAATLDEIIDSAMVVAAIKEQT